MRNNNFIVLYSGGSCGDIVTGIIDPTDATIHPKKNKTKLSTFRSKLKDPQKFKNDASKDAFLKKAFKIYKSIPSHDLPYHIKNNHTFVGIKIKKFSNALWAAERFKNLHDNDIWEEMCKLCGAKSIKDYAQIIFNFGKHLHKLTKYIVSVEEIISGNADSILEEMLQIKLSKKSLGLYRSWLDVNDV